MHLRTILLIGIGVPLAASAKPAMAQYYRGGVAVGPAWTGYYGLPDSPGIAYGPAWGYQGAAGSFWTNGQSLYGAPVPTNGVVPGSFGGSDGAKHYFNTPPYFGLGWGGYRSPLPGYHGAARDFAPTTVPPGYSPRFGTKDVKNRYAAVAADPGVGVTLATREFEQSNPWVPPVNGAPAPAISFGPTLRLRVRVPEAASVWVQGQPMTVTGADRLFESPPLTAGVEYRYTVTAKLADDRTVTKEVVGKPGETVVVAFDAAGK